MKYISVKEAANKWKVTERSVRNYCQNGKINGSYITGKTWLIPENAEKPGNKVENISVEGEIGGLIKFLDESPVSFWAIENAKKKLMKAGYKELQETENDKLKLGDKVFYVRNGTSLVALNIGKKITEDNYPLHIIASHCDSPTFKIKPECDSITDIYNKINTEPYGGMIRSTWLDRPLSLAGRVLVKQDNAIVSKLVNVNKDLLIIPNMCIHFNRAMNDGYSYNPATDLQPLLGQELGDDALKTLLGDELSVDPNNIINFDLYLYNRNKAPRLRPVHRKSEDGSRPARIRISHRACVRGRCFGAFRASAAKRRFVRRRLWRQRATKNLPPVCEKQKKPPLARCHIRLKYGAYRGSRAAHPARFRQRETPRCRFAVRWKAPFPTTAAKSTLFRARRARECGIRSSARCETAAKAPEAPF